MSYADFMTLLSVLWGTVAIIYVVFSTMALTDSALGNRSLSHRDLMLIFPGFVLGIGSLLLVCVYNWTKFLGG